MTAERDRLIDVLQEEWLRFIADDTPGDEWGQLADRLIAAGVLLMDEHNDGDSCIGPHCLNPEHGWDADIDVERLARALPFELHIDEAHGFPPGYTAADLAAAIAAAYREDAG